MPVLVVFAGLCAGGCAPEIGAPCQSALNCSITGDRTCDASAPGGMCTVFGCEEGTCPPEATCVRWRPMESRLAFTACMRRCEVDGHCRVDEGYACLTPSAIVDPSTGEPLAELVDTDEVSFCVATEPE